MSYVNLSSTRIGDDDLKDLESLDDVDVLDLSGTKVTDAGLVHLKRLTRLQMLVLTATHVTPAGIADLRQALPDVAIIFSCCDQQPAAAQAGTPGGPERPMRSNSQHAISDLHRLVGGRDSATLSQPSV